MMIKNNDKIHIYIISPKHAFHFEQKLLKDYPNDFLITHFKKLHQEKQPFDESRIKHVTNEADFLFQAVLALLDALKDENIDSQLIDDWITGLIGAITEFELAMNNTVSLFEEMYDELMDRYQNDGNAEDINVVQDTFCEHLHNRYETSDIVAAKKNSIASLVIRKLSAPPKMYQSIDVLDVVLTFFEIAFQNAFDLVVHSTMDSLKRSQATNTGFVFNFTVLIQAGKIMQKMANEKLSYTLDIARGYLFKKTVSPTTFKLKMEQFRERCCSALAWTSLINTLRVVYEIRYLDKILDNDIHLVLMDVNLAEVLIHELVCLGYQNDSRLIKYNVQVTFKQQKKQIVPIFNPILFQK